MGKRGRKIKERRRPRAIAAVTWRLSLLTGIIWIALTFAITITETLNIREIMCEDMHETLTYDSRHQWLGEALKNDVNPAGYLEYEMWDAINWDNHYSRYIEYDNGLLNVLRDVDIEYDSASVITDAEGNLMYESCDYIYFKYATKEEWEAGTDGYEIPMERYSRAILDGDILPQEEREQLERTLNYINAPFIRVTGVMEGQEITPWLIEYLIDAWDSDEEAQQWQTVLQRPGDMPEGAVTLYSSLYDVSIYDEFTGEVRINGTEYGSVLDMAEYAASPEYLYTEYGMFSGLPEFQKETLTEVVRTGCFYYYDYSGWEPSEETPNPPLALIKVTAMRGRPLAEAVKSLRNLYIVSLIICIIGTLALRNRIRSQLTNVVETVAEGLREKGRPVYSPGSRPPDWREPYELIDVYRDTANLLQNKEDKIKRLQTALDYAKNAEEQRRTLTSNMAHELKTPLAIVRSHAEGLLEGIAGERRQEYLEAIVSETDRMDGMILRMLELSRLEAGRVKLQREEFRLDELVEETLVRYQPSITGKGLTLEKDLPATVVSADRERVEEIIENLLTNAVKYCRQNGVIKVSCQQVGRGDGEFTVYNDADFLSDEATERIWEPFYRVSSSRTDRGTGLGLPIVRGLVELHGGEVYVRNTDGGVEFGFRI